MAKNSCILYPDHNGDKGTLYKEILKGANHNRPLANYIFASYLVNGVAAQMDSLGKKRNKLGNHSGKDVCDFFQVTKMINESTDIFKAEKEIGAKDNLGNVIDITDVKEAMQKAEDFNNTHTGLIASVIRHGDKFHYLIEQKDSRTHIKTDQVSEAISLYQTVEQVFNNKGVDLEKVRAIDGLDTIVNIINPIDFSSYLINLQATRNGLLSVKDIKFLLAVNEGDSTVQRLITKYGSIEDAATKIWDSYRNPASVSSSEKLLMDNALTRSKSLGGVNPNDLKSQLISNSKNLSANSTESNIQQQLRVLNKKYNINAKEIHLIGKDIDSLSKAAAMAAMTIERQRRRLEAQKGTTAQSKKLETTLRQLMDALEGSRYYAGCLNFLKEATEQIPIIEGLLNNLPNTGTTLEIAKAQAEALMEIKKIMDGYYHVVEALAHIDDITTDENISDTDKATLKMEATKIKDFFDKENRKLKSLRKSTMQDILISVLGDKLPNGVAVANLVEMAEKDSSVFDVLYSIGRSGNPLVASMGKIIRDAQDDRDKIFNDFERRIRIANDKLYKSGSTSEFMYDTGGNIISDIDWTLYSKARRQAYLAAKKSGIKGIDLKDYMDAWEENNTEERVVDNVSGRTERVPDSNYRKVFPTLTPAQQEYYDTMMQIKGEIGTLLPSYAQKQYLAPQLRRDTLDALARAKGVKDVATAVRNKMEDIWKVREDDDTFNNNGVIDGEEYGIMQGGLDNTPLRQIPIFYINKLKDQKELLKDFSSGLQALASTAVNYAAMSKVQDTVEFMQDYVEGIEVAASVDGVKQADALERMGLRVVQKLVGTTKATRTSAIMEGFIDMHLYGVKSKDNSKITKLVQSLLAYNSVKSLALNVKGMISNFTIGEYQMMIEAAGGEFYGIKDYLWAHKTLFGDSTWRVPGKVIDFFTNNKESYDVLLGDRFDVIPGGINEKGHKRYYKSGFRQLLGSNFVFLGYGTGEHFLHYLTLYAMLHNKKVLIDGKKATLYDAFEKVGDKNNPKLVLKPNVTDVDGNPITEEYIDTFRKRVRGVNQSTNGAMNEEDKGLIHQRYLGKMVMNFRQWMVETYSKRERGDYYDASLDEFRVGYNRDFRRWMLGLASEFFRFEAKAALHWSDMTLQQKANVRRASAGMILIGSLMTLSLALGEPDEHKKEFWYRMWIYQTRRAVMDLQATETPFGTMKNGLTILNSPIPSINTVNGLLYPFTNINDIDKTIKRGEYKGQNLYWRNIKKYVFPFWKDIEQLKTFDEDDYAFKIFEKQ